MSDTTPLADVNFELPCLACCDERAYAVRARLGAIFLDLEAGKLPQVPTRAELCRGCCRNIRTAVRVPNAFL
jgi:hypothetical protein